MSADRTPAPTDRASRPWVRPLLVVAAIALAVLLFRWFTSGETTTVVDVPVDDTAPTITNTARYGPAPIDQELFFGCWTAERVTVEPHPSGAMIDADLTYTCPDGPTPATFMIELIAHNGDTVSLATATVSDVERGTTVSVPFSQDEDFLGTGGPYSYYLTLDES